ncbi:MAG TPA: glycosyltransferase family 4 protein [Candidatus Acidoferrales bacterium]|nr:glycosyltransferase family 4 protein [Candidatus Acidoferrales bacterium]
MPQKLRIAFLTHEPFYPPSGGGSAEAVYLVQEMARRGHEVHVFGPMIPEAEAVAKKFGIVLHQFQKWEMGRYAKLRNFKYLVYPFFLERMVVAAVEGTDAENQVPPLPGPLLPPASGREGDRSNGHKREGDESGGCKFDLVFSQHAISAVAAGKLKKKLGVPVVMNFPDLLTGFMETWPSYVAPKPVVQALMRYEISLPVRYGVDGVCAISDEFTDRLAARGYPREQICPIYYGYDAQAFPLRQQLPAAGSPSVVVMHGSFDAHHLGQIAFEAVKTVVAKRPETVFRFVGRRTAGLEKFLQRAHGIPGFKSEVPGFTPYAEVSAKLASATVGIVPYEESAGTHCAFVAKIVEYIATGLPTVCTPLRSVRGYFKNDPLVKFAGFEGVSFGEKILEWLAAPVGEWQPFAEKSSARVRAELDWQPLCRKAVDFAEKVQRGE